MTRTVRLPAWAGLLAALLPAPARAGDGPIQDNSFLVEEAYNQEPGVIQHISALNRTARTGAWAYTFTEEWPLGGLTHQGSVTLPVERASAAEPAGLGEILLNYRWQALGDGHAIVACAPRFSLVLPTGNPDHGRGYGGTGLQAGIPVSVALGSAFVAHSNADLGWIPEGRSGGRRASVREWSLGQSLVWLAHHSVNFLAEAVYAEARVRSGGRTASTASVTLNPGVRAELELPGDLDVVAGVAAPIGVGPSRGERGLFLYLSFEHPIFGERE